VSVEESIPASEGQLDLFRLLVESVKDYAIFLLDPTGHIMSWNEGARRIKGYTPQEIIGKHFSIFYPPADVKHGKPDYGLRIATDEGRWQEENWRVRKDGTRFWANVVITALHDQSGELVGFAKVTRDLTERKRSEEERIRLLELEHTARTQTELMVERLSAIQSVTEAALAHLELDELLAGLLDRVVDVLSVDTVAVLLLEAEGDVLVARAAKGIEEEVEQGVRIQVGQGFAGQIAAERRPIILPDVEQAGVLNPLLHQKGIKSLLGVPLVIERRILGVMHVGSLHRREFNDQDIQLLQIVADRVALAIDHAQLFEAARSARHEAEVAEATIKARDEFLSVAAHELKTPMTSLRLSAQTLLRRLSQGSAPDPVALQRSLRTVDRQIDRLSRLVTQLLETVRVQADRLELTCSEVDLSEMAQGVVEQMQPQTSHHRLVLHATGPVRVNADAVRLEQVLTNLLDNAIKFSPEGGPIDVEVCSSPNGARLVVRDRGLGVPEQHRSHLFERFYQAHGTDHRSGMGLGLFICREVVEMHGGSINAEFPSDGGTRFVVDLPRGNQESAA
jgi:PAS domain S-box-containing protein